ncbi:MAG: helix-turn-helix transcriptional regulator [Bdellovibrionaceae bacterium]|nr:helix-turn-helix transcriptional regulator [Pseudobdellovibrionaceae bacterium]
MEGFGRKLKKLRLERRISMREAARRIGVPETTYREWEYGRKILGEPYQKIATAFGVSLERLLGESQEEVSIENRIHRIISDLTMVHTELIQKRKKKTPNSRP